MGANKKILSIIISMLFLLSIASISIFLYSFKQLSVKITTDKAVSIAQDVRDGLTAHMVNGTMANREFFLNNISKNQKLENFHLLRAPSVIKQHGAGSYGESVASDAEKRVIKTKKMDTELIESIAKVYLKISIPYIASEKSTPNCMQCHDAKEGEVLGIISMDLDYTAIRTEGIIIAFKIFIILLVLLLLSIYIINYFIKPYIKLFDDLENGISQVYSGNFSYQIDTTLTDEAGIVAQRLNELSEIYKFKKTIELDENKEVIYDRIIHIFKHKFNIDSFILFELNNSIKQRNIIYDTADTNKTVLNKNANICRAFRTSSHVFSTDFDNICLNCNQNKKEYICLNYNIDEDYSVVFHIQPKDKDELIRIEKLIPIISNYFDMAKPVIETKILMNILKETTLRDPMTTLHNRRFLDELFDSNVTSRVKEGFHHAILMLDIDFFKQVNDTYGHDIGDEVIKRLAKNMKDSIRDSDVVARFGGEEFVILLTNTTKEKTMEISKTINKLFASESFSADGKIFQKTLSIGVSYYPQDASTLWKTLKFADEALYVSKNTGRNKVTEFDESMHIDGDNY